MIAKVVRDHRPLPKAILTSILERTLALKEVPQKGVHVLYIYIANLCDTPLRSVNKFCYLEEVLCRIKTVL